jgi:hypothetical protein
MFYGRPPFESTSLKSLMNQILHDEPNYERERPVPHTATISDNFKALLAQMLQVTMDGEIKTLLSIHPPFLLLNMCCFLQFSLLEKPLRSD